MSKKPRSLRRRPARGRPPKLYGTVSEKSDGTKVRFAVFKVKERHLFKPIPRGKTGAAHPFVMRVKEWSPFVHALVVQELGKPPAMRDSGVLRMITAWQHLPNLKSTPPAYELTAFIVERAFQTAWRTWNVTRPWTSGEAEHFVRRYVYGHRGALQAYRRIAAESQPWPSDHRGHLLRSLFFGKPDAATRFYEYEKKTDEPFVLVTWFTESDQIRFLRGKRLRPGDPPQ